MNKRESKCIKKMLEKKIMVRIKLNVKLNKYNIKAKYEES